jgi:hypothetical protein
LRLPDVEIKINLTQGMTKIKISSAKQRRCVLTGFEDIWSADEVEKCKKDFFFQMAGS